MVKEIKIIHNYINNKEVIVVSPKVLEQLKSVIEDLEAYEDLCETFNNK